MTHALIDTRDLSYNRLQATGGFARLETFISAAPATLGHSLVTSDRHVSAYTGHLTELRADSAPSSFAATNPPSDGEFIQAAKSYMRSVSGAVGFEANDPIEFEGDSKVTRTSSDSRVVSLQQTLNGIEVWGMEPKVWFDVQGRVDRIKGDTVSLPASLPTEPNVAPETALLVAAREAGAARRKTDMLGESYELPALDLSQWTPQRAGQENRAARTTSFDNGPFEDVAAATLVYFYMGSETRLAWRFVIAREFHSAQFLALVEANAADPAQPAILYLRDMTSSAIGGHVFEHNPAEGPLTRVDFPLALTAYPLPQRPGLPAGFPLPWTAVQDGRLSTVGNNVYGLNGSSRQPYSFAVAAGATDFVPNAYTPEQYITNIFFFCNYMHDFFLLLGFDEQHGNFQQLNSSSAGRGADPVYAFAHPGGVYGTANMATRADGAYATMNMGMVTKTGLHTANDADVVFHEYVHGVSNRLVGGLRDAQGLNEEQSVAMGEGWSDFFALTIRNYSRATERTITGNYVSGLPGGIRQRPYDEKYPGNFGFLGMSRGQIPGHPDLGYDEVHDAGEIWCAALMQMVRNVTGALQGNKATAYQLSWQAVVDGLKLTPKNPSFLTARDAILQAWSGLRGNRLAAADYMAVRQAVWTAFAQFGMGHDAWCPNASLSGCTAGFGLPPAGWED